MSPPLWQHQIDAIAQIDAALDTGETRIVVKIPTGGGKTKVASAFIIQKKYVEAGARVAFCMPRLDLVEQTIRAFREAGISHIGVIQGSHYLTDKLAPVQICSEQTLARREIPQFDLILMSAIFSSGRFLNGLMIRSCNRFRSSACPRRPGRRDWASTIGR